MQGSEPETQHRPISLYEVSIGSSLQTIDALAGVLDKALAHVRDRSIDPEVIVATRLFADMQPFRFPLAADTPRLKRAELAGLRTQVDEAVFLAPLPYGSAFRTPHSGSAKPNP